MKKLKIFLPLIFSFLLMFLFISKTHAKVSDYYTEWVYSDILIENLDIYKNKINFINDYLGNNIIYSGNTAIDINTNNFIIIYDMDTINSNSVVIRFLNVTNSNNYISNTYTQYQTDQRLGLNYSFYEFNCSFFNNNLTSCSNVSSGSAFYRKNYYDISCNPTTENCLFEENKYYFDVSYINNNTNLNFSESFSSFNQYYDIPIKYDELISLPNTFLNYKDFFEYFLSPSSPVEPSYSYTSTLLDNGNVKIDFQFTDYIEGAGYGFEILNFVSGEYYGDSNPYSSIFPNNIPYGNSFSIEVSYDTIIYISLYQYFEVEGTSLYTRDEVYSEEIDIDNVVFDNQEDPYFSVSLHTNNKIIGEFKNTKSGYSCKYRNSNNNIIGVVICDEEIVNETFNFNGWVEFYIENSLGTEIYSRKINVLGGATNNPYIIYNTEKQDFYSVINWSVENSISNLEYRFSTDNGINYSSWISLDNNTNTINVYENTTVIIEISNHDHSIIYDSKAIKVVNSVENLKTFNNTTNNFIAKFRSLFYVNSNILRNVTIYWNTLKTSKIYLLIFIPFITSLICAIIYLIRR